MQLQSPWFAYGRVFAAGVREASICRSFEGICASNTRRGSEEVCVRPEVDTTASTDLMTSHDSRSAVLTLLAWRNGLTKRNPNLVHGRVIEGHSATPQKEQCLNKCFYIARVVTMFIFKMDL